ncbi:tripartite tricarboxylate transporter TctB family protein [Microvirga roseola]|uniref:tripartite tricarboxylate transporter TctB family protein n=1 Tax=Microvirga roseola TaxID=2883126 RepID=UPI001E5A3B05|nr:tripartite tricarboxylate transporter TctB family protein [Microvirga roseola]
MSDRIAGAIFLALAVWCWIAAGEYAVDFSDPAGPALFPRMVALPLGLLSLFLIIRPDPDPGWIRWPQVAGQIATIAVLFVYPALLEPAGFPLATMLATVVLAKILGASWLQAVLGSIVVSFGLFILFDWGFGLPLPIGSIFG